MGFLTLSISQINKWNLLGKGKLMEGIGFGDLCRYWTTVSEMENAADSRQKGVA